MACHTARLQLERAAVGIAAIEDRAGAAEAAVVDAVVVAAADQAADAVDRAVAMEATVAVTAEDDRRATSSELRVKKME